MALISLLYYYQRDAAVLLLVLETRNKKLTLLENKVGETHSLDSEEKP